MTVGELVAVANQGGALPLMVLIIIAFVRRWVVTKAELDEMREDRDQWRESALRGTGMAETLVDTVPMVHTTSRAKRNRTAP